MTTGRKHLGDKETWWWDDKVQMAIKAKKEAKKTWETSRRQDDKDRYREANKAANKPVATTKALETPEGERKIFRIAKARDKATKNLSHMKHRTNIVWF